MLYEVRDLGHMVASVALGPIIIPQGYRSTSGDIPDTPANVGTGIVGRSRHRIGYSVGTHTLTWNGTNSAGMEVSAGTYLVQMRSDTTTKSQKISLVR